MGNKKDLSWVLIIFTDMNRKTIWKIFVFDTIKDLSYTLGINPQIVSNYYHRLIKERGILQYCNIYQTTRALSSN